MRVNREAMTAATGNEQLETTSKVGN
ncbi:hypothetical protein A2U01_0105327, partial [Trifolium medium]|nr:hypothetical protein [Trifolium medium]